MVTATRAVPLLAALGDGLSNRNLVCFPHAGGGPAAYRWWAGTGPRVWAVTLPGRGRLRHEPPAERWQPLVARLAAEVAALSGPVVLFGHSLGALLAYETARTLSAARRAPAHLVVSACGAPESTRTAHWPADPDELLDAVAARYGGIPDSVRHEPQLRRVMAGTLRADLNLVRRYAWAVGPRLDCPVTAVRGASDDTVRPVDLDAWTRHTRGDFLARTLPGGHFFRDADRPALLDLVRRRAWT